MDQEQNEVLVVVESNRCINEDAVVVVTQANATCGPTKVCTIGFVNIGFATVARRPVGFALNTGKGRCICVGTPHFLIRSYDTRICVSDAI